MVAVRSGVKDVGIILLRAVCISFTTVRSVMQTLNSI